MSAPIGWHERTFCLVHRCIRVFHLSAAVAISLAKSRTSDNECLSAVLLRTLCMNRALSEEDDEASVSRLSFLTENKSYYREFEAAIDVVQKACRLCVDVQSSLFSKGGGFFEKGDCTPVTVADYGVQALISMELSRLFPSIPLVAEEDSSQLLLELEKFHQDGNDASMSLVEAVANVVANSAGFQGEPLNHDEVLNAIDKGAKQTTTLEEKPATYWVLDPIDGTRGFLRDGNTLYVVGLGLVVAGKLSLGVMGCPNWVYKGIGNKNEIDDLTGSGIIMAAYHGCGTWAKRFSFKVRNMELDGSVDGWIRCSVDRCDSINEARFCIADRETWELLPLSSALVASAISEGNRDKWKPTILPTCCGSLCKYMTVASGRASIFILQVRKQSTVKVWDHAAGIICVAEAGGKVTDWLGSELKLAGVGDERREIIPGGGGILVTNGTLHNQILKLI